MREPKVGDIYRHYYSGTGMWGTLLVIKIDDDYAEYPYVCWVSVGGRERVDRFWLDFFNPRSKVLPDCKTVLLVGKR